MSPKEQVDLLIKHGFTITMDKERRVFTDGFVAIEGGKIVDIGSASACSYSAKRTIDGADKVVMPGLINCHDHLVQWALRGLGEEMPFIDRVRELYFPISGAMYEERAYYGAANLCLELIKGGITTTHDDHFTHIHKDSVEGVCRAIQESGMRGVISRSIVNAPAVVPEAFREKVEEGLREVKRVRERWNSDRVEVVTGPVGLGYVSEPDDLVAIKEFTEAEKCQFYGHFPSGRAAVWLKKLGWTRSAWAYMDSLGLLDESVMTMGGPVTPEDYALLASKKVKTVTEPALPVQMGRGSDVKRRLAAGITVALGLDGVPINPNQDLWETMKYAIFAQRAFDIATAAGGFARGDISDAWGTAEIVLEMATLHGADALLMADSIGSLERGKEADLILLDANRPYLNPREKLLTNLVFAGHAEAVETVIVGGEIILEERKSTKLDEEEMVAKANEIQREVLKETNTERFLTRSITWKYM